MKRFQLNELSQQIKWEALDTHFLNHLANLAYTEDLIGYGGKNVLKHPIDITTHSLNLKGLGQAAIIAREPLIVCGIPFIEHFIEIYDKTVVFKPHINEGQLITKGDCIGTLEGDVPSLLKIERPLLNTLQFLSGIATHAMQYTQLLKNSTTRLLDTRKTLPGWRYLQKYAVACGGAYNHRIGLFDRILIKDNHLAALNITEPKALTHLLSQIKKEYPNYVLEVEIDEITQLEPVLKAEVDIILCDNFSNELLKEAIEKINGTTYIEASGGISSTRLPQIANIGLDFISMGALTQQAAHLDIALDWL